MTPASPADPATTPAAPQEASASTPRSEAMQGLRDTVPLLIGALPFGLIFGALAVTSGLSPAATIAFSSVVFAGSSQFIAANLIAGGASVVLIVFTTFIVNVRHALYSATLGPHLKHLPQRWLLPLGFWLTDETFAITVTHYENSPSPHKHWYQLASSVAMYLNWNFWTILGLFAGSRISNPAEWGLQYAMVVTFIGLVVPTIKNRPLLMSVIVAGVTAFLTYSLPHNLYLIASAATGITAGYLTETWQGRGRV
jgi:4-azaleucine resistance transporter AzlC